MFFSVTFCWYSQIHRLVPPGGRNQVRSLPKNYSWRRWIFSSNLEFLSSKELAEEQNANSKYVTIVTTTTETTMLKSIHRHTTVRHSKWAKILPKTNIMSISSSSIWWGWIGREHKQYPSWFRNWEVKVAQVKWPHLEGSFMPSETDLFFNSLKLEPKSVLPKVFNLGSHLDIYTFKL